MATTVLNIEQAIETLLEQLKDSGSYPKKYYFLNRISDYLKEAEEIANENNTEFDEYEELYTFLTHECNWDDDSFPMSL